VVGLITLSVLLLSAAGVYALMSFTVSRRQREIGIRSALGASRSRIVWSIFSRTGRQLALGLALGALATGALDRLSGGELLRGQATVLLATVAALMVLAGAIASTGPARRALRIQPMEALRQE
jgi:ABC-type antimicrobial peptide transport system permease subunit